ncbi:MAG: phosphate ABC transporter substrate-binding protein PstS [Actinobacteria bacterium]|nr:phosphate ABC transporter substrate-binding protein PstS [Actinomycetota bacterium]
MLRKGPTAWSMALLVAVGLVSTACGGTEGSTSTSEEVRTTAPTGVVAPTSAEIAALSTKVSGGGASFPDAFYQAVNTDFNGLAGRELVTYAKSGSSDGRKQLASGTLDIAGSDSLPKPEETWPSTLLFFPTVAAPITISYNLQGVSELRIAPDTIAKVFQGAVTRWDDPAIQADNPGIELPPTSITVVHRSDGSGTTSNFTKYLSAAAPSTWKLGSGDTVNWPASTQGAEKNSGVAAVIGKTAGAIGYVDLADAVKAGLSFAEVENREGQFVAPTAAGTASAVEHAEVAANLTYDPLNAAGRGTYPITAPTYLLVLRSQADAGKASTLRTFLRYLLTTGQAQASKLGYVALPAALQQKAHEQVDRIGA